MMTLGVQTSPAAQSGLVAHSLQNVSGRTPPVSMICSQLRPAAHPVAAGSHMTPRSPLVHPADSVSGLSEHVPTPAVWHSASVRHSEHALPRSGSPKQMPELHSQPSLQVSPSAATPVGAPMQVLVVAPAVSPAVSTPVVLVADSVVVIGSPVEPGSSPLEPEASAVSLLASPVEVAVADVPNDAALFPKAPPSSVPEVHAIGSQQTHNQPLNRMSTTIAGCGPSPHGHRGDGLVDFGHGETPSLSVVQRSCPRFRVVLPAL